MDISGHKFAIRMYGGAFIIQETQTPRGNKFTILHLPYYYGTQLKAWIGWAFENINTLKHE